MTRFKVGDIVKRRIDRTDIPVKKDDVGVVLETNNFAINHNNVLVRFFSGHVINCNIENLILVEGNVDVSK
jgi:hypothetical protein